MPNYEWPRWRKARVVVNSSNWTPIVAPDDYDFMALRCDTSALVYRTDQDDPDTEDEMPAAVQDGVTGANTGPHLNWAHNNRSRFRKGTPVCYVKSSQITATVVITWIL
jgi:hypothetical protein